MARYHLVTARRVYDEVSGRAFDAIDVEPWAEYQAWLAGGGVPDPLPPKRTLPPAEVAARAELAARKTMRADLKTDGVIDYLRTHTPAEAAAWVQTNVTDLATAKNVLSKLAMIVAYLARERLSNRD